MRWNAASMWHGSPSSLSTWITSVNAVMEMTEAWAQRRQKSGESVGQHKRSGMEQGFRDLDGVGMGLVM